MAENFSRIEDYINNKLSDTQKGEFENELKNNQVLTEQYNFYKNIKKQQAIELKPITYQKKILPEINNINFTEKKDKPNASGRAIVGIIVIFIALSSYLFITNNSNENEIAILNAKKDSIEHAYQHVLSLASEHSNIEVNTDNLKNEAAKNLQKIIVEKEKEIAILKKDSEGAASLKEEIEVLKKEIAKVKQEYYENAGNFADDDKNKTSVDKDLLNNLSVFTSGMNLVFKWKNNTKYKINFYTSDKVLLHATSDYINARWQIKKPENGFLLLNLTLVEKGTQNFF